MLTLEGETTGENSFFKKRFSDGDWTLTIMSPATNAEYKKNQQIMTSIDLKNDGSDISISFDSSAKEEKYAALISTQALCYANYQDIETFFDGLKDACTVADDARQIIERYFPHYFAYSQKNQQD